MVPWCHSANCLLQINTLELRIVEVLLIFHHGSSIQARVVNTTWASRCNKVLFVTDKKDPSLPTMELLNYDSRDKLWGKTKMMFTKAVTDKNFSEFDWIPKEST